MRNRKLKPTLIGSAIGMLILILDSKTALNGVQQGIEMCIRTVIPSLFPFFFVSGLMTSSFLGRKNRLLGFIGKRCGIPSGAESLLVTGLLGGYPVGAQVISQAWASGAISEGDGRRMLGFCNNPGPAFLFGMVAPFFSTPAAGWMLWLSIIVSAILTGVLLPGKNHGQAVLQERKPFTPSIALNESIRIMASVCGWVVLFKLLMVFLQRWFLWLLPQAAQVLIAGLLELSNGCMMLGNIENPGLRYLICAGFLSLGGCCVTMQTATAAGKLGLKMYFPGKCLQTSICLIIAYATQYFLFSGHHRWENWLFPATIFIFGAFCVKILYKTSRKMLPVGV